MTLPLQGQVTLSAGVQSWSGAIWHLNADRVCQGRVRPQRGQRESFRGQGGKAARA